MTTRQATCWFPAALAALLQGCSSSPLARATEKLQTMGPGVPGRLFVVPGEIRGGGEVLIVDVLLDGPAGVTERYALSLACAVRSCPEHWMEVLDRAGNPVELRPLDAAHVWVDVSATVPAGSSSFRCRQWLVAMPAERLPDGACTFRLRPDAPYGRFCSGCEIRVDSDWHQGEIDTRAHEIASGSASADAM